MQDGRLGAVIAAFVVEDEYLIAANLQDGLKT